MLADAEDSVEPAKVTVTEPGGRVVAALTDEEWGRLPSIKGSAGARDEGLLGAESSPGAQYCPNICVGDGDAWGDGELGGGTVAVAVASGTGSRSFVGDTVTLAKD